MNKKRYANFASAHTISTYPVINNNRCGDPICDRFYIQVYSSFLYPLLLLLYCIIILYYHIVILHYQLLSYQIIIILSSYHIVIIFIMLLLS